LLRPDEVSSRITHPTVLEVANNSLIAAAPLRDFKGQHIGLLSPLVMNRNGVYTELAEWARPRGFTHLRVDGAPAQSR
jgi:excinuclease ABC subunit A